MLVENVQGAMIRDVVRPVPGFVLFDDVLGMNKLRRCRQRELEHGFVSSRGGFLRKKTDGCTFLESDLAAVGRCLAEDQREQS